MTQPHDPPPPLEPARTHDRGRAATHRTPPGRRVSRRTALAVAGGLAALLGLGWLGDTLAGLPLGTASPDRSTHAAGFYRVRLTFAPTPPVAGRLMTLTVTVTDATGQAVNGARARFALSMVAMDMGTTRLTAYASGAGRYMGAMVFPMSGTWNVEVTIEAAGQPDATTTFTVGVR